MTYLGPFFSPFFLFISFLECFSKIFQSVATAVTRSTDIPLELR
jgi:hypothetical protein